LREVGKLIAEEINEYWEGEKKNYLSTQAKFDYSIILFNIKTDKLLIILILDIMYGSFFIDVNFLEMW